MLKEYMKATSILLLLFICVASGSAFANGPEPPPPKWTARLAAHYAVQNNPDIGIALQRLQSAQASVTMEKSSFYPRLSFSTRYSQTDNPMYSFGNILNQGDFNTTVDFNNPGRTDDLNMGLRLNYNFYNGGRDQSGINSAEAMELHRLAPRPAIMTAPQAVPGHASGMKIQTSTLAPNVPVVTVTGSTAGIVASPTGLIPAQEVRVRRIIPVLTMSVRTVTALARSQPIQVTHSLRLPMTGVVRVNMVIALSR